ncbi:ATP-binding protein [Massilia sp. SR12]
MLDMHTRPIALADHPLTQHKYIIATPSINALIQKVKRLIRMHTPGGMIYAHPRFGKTYSIRYIIRVLKQDYPGAICLTFGAEAKKTSSEDSFFTCLLEAAGHQGALTGSVTRKRRRLIERVTELVDGSGLNWVVLFADEAQRLEVMEYEWLRDVHDCLERKGIRMITLLVGQPQLLNQKTAFRYSQHTQIILRFMVAEMRFDGLTTPEQLAACLQGYDLAVYPANTDWTYTRFFYPQAYANGMRLVEQTAVLWRAFLDAHNAVVPGVKIEIPMQHFAHTIENAFEENVKLDCPDFRFTPAMWERAIQESYFQVAQEELYRDTPAEKPESRKH